MHAPNPAREIISGRRRNFHAGVCRTGCPFNETHGWFVPYRSVAGPDGYEAVIRLFVKDLSSSSLAALPFVIDTAADVTIIPRHMLKQPNAFQPEHSIGKWDVKGLTGRIVTGRRFRATIFVAPLKGDPVPLEFGPLKPVVVGDDWESDYGTLGLDALRQVLMVSDRDHVSLWPAQVDACAD